MEINPVGARGSDEMKSNPFLSAERLQAAFLHDTLQTGKSVYIPVQAYKRRLKEAAQDLWSLGASLEIRKYRR